MIPTVGLIVAVYAIVRLWQIPWEMSAVNGLGRLPNEIRLGAVLFGSIVGAVVIAFLAVTLALTGVVTSVQ